MTRPLILHQITAVGIAQLDFIKMAREVGCDQVSLFTCLPRVLVAALKGRVNLPPAVTPDTKRAVMKALADNDITVSGAEFFPITAEVDFDEYTTGLILAREIGATRAVTHIIDTDRDRAVDKLGTVCELARKEGLSLGLEFTPTTPGCTMLESGVWFVDQVGAANLGIGVDALHLIRSGGTAADIARLAPRYIAYAQFCDGHGLHTSSDYFVEVGNRTVPGKGDFPLRDIFNAVPAATPLEMEVPFEKHKEAGVTLIDHLRATVAGSRAIADTLTPTR